MSSIKRIWPPRGQKAAVFGGGLVGRTGSQKVMVRKKEKKDEMKESIGKKQAKRIKRQWSSHVTDLRGSRVDINLRDWRNKTHRGRVSKLISHSEVEEHFCVPGAGRRIAA